MESIIDRAFSLSLASIHENYHDLSQESYHEVLVKNTVSFATSSKHHIYMFRKLRILLLDITKNLLPSMAIDPAIGEILVSPVTNFERFEDIEVWHIRPWHPKNTTLESTLNGLDGVPRSEVSMI